MSRVADTGLCLLERLVRALQFAPQLNELRIVRGTAGLALQLLLQLRQEIPGKQLAHTAAPRGSGIVFAR